MADSVLSLLFSADTKDLDTAKEKLVDLGSHMPTVGEGIESLAKSFGSIPGPVGLAVAAIGGLSVAFTEMISHTTEAGAQMLETAEAVGMSVEQFQPLAEALAMSGVSAEQATKGLQKLAQSVGQALSEPTGKAADEFRKLGVSQKTLEEGDINKILQETATGFAKYADSAQKTAAERDLLGRQGPQLVAAYNAEKDSIAGMNETLIEYGAKLSTTDAIADRTFNGTLSVAGQMFTGLAMSITKSLLPGLQELATEFMNSGKSGGTMREILDILGGTISVVGKGIISLLVEPLRLLGTIFHEDVTLVMGLSQALKDAIHGNFAQAGQDIKDMGTTMKQMVADYATNAVNFETTLWSGKAAIEDQTKSTTEGTEKFQAFSQAALKVAQTLQGLRDALTAQRSEMAAAALGLNQYRAAQDDVAVAAERLKIANEGGSKAAQNEAEALMRAANAAKQATSDEVAGWNLVNRLVEEQNALLSHNTELEKAKAEIAAHPEMTKAEQEEALATAQAIDAKKQELEVDKEVDAMKAMVTKDIDTQKASMTLSTAELKLYNEQAKLTAQYEKDAFGKTPEQVAQLKNALQQNLQVLKDNAQAVQQFQQSWAGAQAGGVQAMANLYQSATNLNALGNQMTTQFVNGLTTAFTTMGQSGENAFNKLAIALVTFIEQAVVKFALLKAMIAAMEAMGVSPSTINLMLGKGTVTGSANGNAFSGGAVVPFADGGVIGGPTLAPMALMGEAGPEAVMPLQRTSSGKLGVAMTGGGGNGGVGITNHNATFVINSNQNPKEVAKATKKQVALQAKFSKGSIAKQQRPGGLLNNHNPAFAR